MATTFSIKSSSYQGRYLQLSCTQTQNVSANTSTIAWTLTATGGTSSYYSTGATTVKINGEQAYYKDRVSYSAATFPAAKGSTSGSITVKHNSDGSLSIPVSLSTAIYTTTISTVSDTWALDPIPRAATISAAPNFDDESNPTITYSNLAGSTVSTLQACIASSDGKTIYAAYRDISKTGTSYTFNLTTAERNALRSGCTSANSMTVKFYVKTVIGDNTYYSSLAKTLSIINATPTLSPIVEDTDTGMIALTGDSSKLVKYFSDASVTIGAAALKGATVSSKSCVNGSTTLTADGVFSNVTSNSFKFSVTDSRGNTATKTVSPTLINYVKLTCNIDTLNVNTDGVMSFTLKGNYFNGSFGSVSNSLTVQYRYKTDGGSYSSWTSATATKSGNTYTATGSVSGLDYQTTYVFQARALDKVYDGTYQTARSTSEKKVSAKPIFDWDSDDFNFNVPVSITDGDTKYWVSGAVKAMSKYYNLTTTVTPGANYSSASGAAVLLGNNLRVNFKATRSSSIAAGNVANEAMCTLEIAHGGKIGNVWGSYFPILECGGMGYITNIANDTTTNILSITMTLASVQLASSSFQSYFVLPVRLNLNAY